MNFSITLLIPNDDVIGRFAAKLCNVMRFLVAVEDLSF